MRLPPQGRTFGHFKDLYSGPKKNNRGPGGMKGPQRCERAPVLAGEVWARLNRICLMKPFKEAAANKGAASFVLNYLLPEPIYFIYVFGHESSEGMLACSLQWPLWALGSFCSVCCLKVDNICIAMKFHFRQI